MRNVAYLFLVGFVLLARGWSADASDMFEVRVGDDLQAVQAALGEPRGYMMSGDMAVLTYDRGKVELKADKVVMVDLVSTKVAAERRRLREQSQIDRDARLVAEGDRLRDAKLQETAFMFLSAGKQLAYWRSFQSRYSAVDLSAVNIPALAARAVAERDAAAVEARAQEQTRTEAALMDMKWRLMDAEERAHKAQLEADRVRVRRTTGVYYGYDWASYIWPRTIVIGGYPTACRPVAVPHHGVRHTKATITHSTSRELFDNPHHRAPTFWPSLTR